MRRKPPLAISTPPQEGEHYRIEPETDCWVWQNMCSAQGYPRFNRTIDGKNVTIMARQYFYTLHGNEIPKGALLANTCGDRKCVNPAHQKIRHYNTDYGKPDPMIQATAYSIDPLSGCWIWLLQRNTGNGYPVMARIVDGRKKNCSAVRAIFHDVRGSIPARSILRKTCGRKDCVNPDHHMLVQSQED